MASEITVQVAIVGAGLSGLSAAKEVHDAGLTYTVLEGMDRVGGKTLSVPTKDDGTTPIELGAAWINDTSQSEMYALARSYGFELVQQRAEGDSLYQPEDGTISRLPYGVPGPLSPEELQELYHSIAVLTGYINRSDIEHPHLGPDAAELDALTYDEFINRKFPGSHITWKFASSLARGLVGAEAHEMSALFFIDYVKSGTGLLNMGSDQKDGGQYLRNRAGNQQFAKNLAASLHPDSVKLSTPVKAISQDEYGCKIRVGGDGGQLVKAERVIVTVPSPLYPLINFEPALPTTKAELPASKTLGYYAKTVLVFSEPWWRTAGLSGILTSATGEGTGPISFSRDTSIPEDEQWSITCFHVADKGRQWSKLDAEARRAAVLAQFQDAFSTGLANGAVPEPVKVFEKEWSKDEWTRGAPTTIFKPGAMTSEAGKAIRDPFGRVHFAGTETALVWKGYMEGALRSGKRAAGEVINAIR